VFRVNLVFLGVRFPALIGFLDRILVNGDPGKIHFGAVVAAPRRGSGRQLFCKNAGRSWYYYVNGTW
jgi:hypothetical protein